MWSSMLSDRRSVLALRPTSGHLECAAEPTKE
jgi:hypothetical protein